MNSVNGCCETFGVLRLTQRNALTRSRQLYVTMREKRIVPEFDGFPHNEALSLIWTLGGSRGHWVSWRFHTSALRNVWRKERKRVWLVVQPKIKETHWKVSRYYFAFRIFALCIALFQTMLSAFSPPKNCNANYT